jgi:hypothetical protein
MGGSEQMSEKKENKERGDKDVILKREGSELLLPAKMKVPADQSMLSLLSTPGNPIADGLEYADDYWVYATDKDGNRHRVSKWFVRTRTMEHVWDPSLDPKNLKKRELVYHKYVKRAEQHWATIRSILQQIVDAGVEEENVTPTCFLAHANTGRDIDSGWRVYRVHPKGSFAHSMSYSGDWLEVAPDPPVNQELGQRLSELDDYAYSSLYKRKGKVEDALAECIQRTLKQSNIKEPKLLDVSVRLNVNGRDYWYQYTRNQYDQLEFIKTVWSEDDTVVINV